MPLVSVGRERAEGVMTERYTYDPLRRLTGVTDSKGFRAVYEYDAAGNRTRRLVKEYDPKTGAGGVKRTEYVFDNLDPVVEYPVWNGQREEFYRGGVEAFSPTPMLLVMRHFPAGAEGQAYWVHLDGRGSYVCQPKSDPHDHRKVTHFGLGEAGVIIEKCPI